MADWMADVLLSAGLLLLSWSFLRARRLSLRRVGVWLLALSLGLMLWLWTGSLAVGVLGWVLWFGMPMLQAAIASRRLRFSLHRRFVEGTLMPDHFPELSSASRELREQGYQPCGDYWLKPSPQEQAYRVFRHPDENVVAALAHMIQGPVQLRYLMLISRDDEGNTWITWDYPFAYGFRLPPHLLVYRCLEAETLAELAGRHRDFLDINEVKEVPVPADADAVKAFMETIFAQTMDYNLNVGMLQESDDGDQVRYSWRGTFYLIGQVFRETVGG